MKGFFSKNANVYYLNEQKNGIDKGGMMTKDHLEGKWEQVKGRLKEIWADLTDQDMENLSGSFQQAMGYLQEKYGDTKEAIEDHINAWLKKEKDQ